MTGCFLGAARNEITMHYDAALDRVTMLIELEMCLKISNA